MATVTITFEPNDPADLAETRRLLDLLAAGPVAPRVDGDDEMRQRVARLLRGYGEGRRNYLRLIAQSSPERARYDQIAALFDSPKGIGGTHASIEKTWRGLGGAGKFIDTDRNGDSRIDPVLAALVLEQIAELDAEDESR